MHILPIVAPMQVKQTELLGRRRVRSRETPLCERCLPVRTNRVDPTMSVGVKNGTSLPHASTSPDDGVVPVTICPTAASGTSTQALPVITHCQHFQRRTHTLLLLIALLERLVQLPRQSVSYTHLRAHETRHDL